MPKITLCAWYGILRGSCQYWFEQTVRVPVEADIASEFRYRGVMPEGGLAIFTVSGETADTLAALRYRREKTLSIVNVPESTIARESDAVLPTYAGPEIGVASTKAFSQLTVLASLVVVMARACGAIDGDRDAWAALPVPKRAAEVPNHDERLDLAELAAARDVLFWARHKLCHCAGGALKLKEISYIHAEGYAAGEMKYGPIALINDGVPVIVTAPTDPLLEKTASNMQEVIARGGRVFFLLTLPVPTPSVSMPIQLPCRKLIFCRTHPSRHSSTTAGWPCKRHRCRPTSKPGEKRDRGVVSNGWVQRLNIASVSLRPYLSLSKPAPYSKYQHFLHDTIVRFREKGGRSNGSQSGFEIMVMRRSPEKVYANHVSSILKNKRPRDKRLEALPEDSLRLLVL